MLRIIAVALVAVLPLMRMDAQDTSSVANPDTLAPRSTAWNNPSVDSLVERAIARRGKQLADSTLLSYRANAHGFLAFLAQLGEGTLIPPRVVQSEELALTISWWQPGLSAQQLVGRRDTTLLPAEIAYYRDRYAVILDNLPDRIRLGDGFDVSDVPHPLGAGARSQYEFAFVGTRSIRFSGRVIRVDEVQYRPRDDTKPSAVGSVMLDRESAAVVRLSMTFTRAAILDKRIERLVFTLENGLIGTRYWLPRLQEVEVSRRSTWMDIPARGIVRGRWIVSGYELNEAVPATAMRLPRWSSVSSDSLRKYHFEGRVVDVLPNDIKVATDEDVAQTREMAENAVRAASLARSSAIAASGRGISDLVRINRVEGISAGFGISRRWGDGMQLALRGRYGFSDREAKGKFSFAKLPPLGGLPTFELFAERDYRDLATAERSGVVNSAAAVLFGSDFTTQVDTRAAGFTWRLHALSKWQLRVAYEHELPLQVNAKPISGDYEPTIAASELKGVRAEFRANSAWRNESGLFSGGTWSLSTSAARYSNQSNPSRRTVSAVRVGGALSAEHAFSNDRALVLQTSGGLALANDHVAQWNVFAGGPLSGPGYGWSAFAGRAIISQRVEFRQPIPAPRISLGKYGRAPGHVTLAPYASVVGIAGTDRQVTSVVDGVYPSAGLGVLFFFDLVRVDAARGLRNRLGYPEWRFSIDIDRGFWGVL